MKAILICLAIWTALVEITVAQSGQIWLNPIGCADKGADKTVNEIRFEINRRLGHAEFENAYEYCATATLMKRVGDSRTEEYYSKAIIADPQEAAYELFYADYLRNFRGPNRPLFSEAEKHYLEASKKVAARTPSRPWDQITKDRLERAMIALYQEDGFPVLFRPKGQLLSDGKDSVPLAFVASINRYAHSTADLDRDVDDIRDYTSEALLSNSRLPQPLTAAGLKGLIRTKEPFETLDRIRFRYKSLPSLDVFYTYRQTPHDAVTSFFNPAVFNSFILNDYGFSAEKPFTISKNFDADIVASFREIRQQGLIEFSPTATEEIRDYETKAAVSHFVGPDKVILQFNYAYQAIHAENVKDHPDRDREFTGATLTYQLLRPLGFRRKSKACPDRQPACSPYDRHFEIRGWDFFGGFLIDNERFTASMPIQNTTVIRRDYFGGVSLKGMGRFDLTIQPTVFSSSSSSHIPESNSQYRTNVTLLGRIIDEERTPGIPNPKQPLNVAFWQMVLLLRQDNAFHNLKAYENYRAGIESEWKFFTVPRRTTFLASVGYSFQRFYRLNKNENIFNVSLTMGF